MSSFPSTLDTRERLLSAALEVFAERGYAGGTIREICGRAKANLAAVHYYYGDKRGLYVAIFDRLSDLFHERRTRYQPNPTPPQERLRVYIRAALEEILNTNEGQEYPSHLSAIYLAEMAHPTEVLDQIVAHNFKPHDEELRTIIAQLLGLEASASLVVNTAASISGQILNYFFARPLLSRLNPEYPPSEERLDELAHHIWQFSLGGIEALRSRVSQEAGERRSERLR